MRLLIWGPQKNCRMHLSQSKKNRKKIKHKQLIVSTEPKTRLNRHKPSAPQNQMNKIQNSHRVYWVSVPPSKINDVMSGFVFEMDPKVATSFMHRLKTGREVMCFKRNQEGMKIVYQIKDQKLLKHLQELSTSYL